MKNTLKYLISALIVGSSLLGVAHAQVSSPNYWRTNVPSSTISPINSSLKVPCANIANGCGGGAASTTINGVQGPTFTFSIVNTSSASSITTSSQQLLLNLLQYTSGTDINVAANGVISFVNTPGFTTVSTSSANTWSQPQTFNGITVGAGGFISSATSTLNFFANIDTILYASTTSSGDYGAYLAGLCASSLANASGSLIQLPQFSSPAFSTQVVENGRCLFQGVGGGGTILNWNGAQGTSAFVMQFPATPHITGGGVENITFNNLGSATTTNPTIAILQSGGATTTSGGAHSIIAGNTFIGFGDPIENATGTYDTTIEWNTFRANGQSFYAAPAVNSGESVHMLYNWSVDQLSSTNGANCIQFGTSSVEIAFMVGNTTDNCQVNFGVANTVVVNGDEVEDAGGADGSFIPFVQGSSATGNLTMSGIQVYNDGTTAGTTYSNIFSIAGNATINGVEINKNAGASSTPNLLTGIGSNTNLQISGVVNVGGNSFSSWGSTNGLASVPTTTFNGTTYIENGGAVVTIIASSSGAIVINNYNATTSMLNVNTNVNSGAVMNVAGNNNSQAISITNGNIVFGNGWGENVSGGANAFGLFFTTTGLGQGITSPLTQFQVGASSTERLGVVSTAWTGCVEEYDHTNSSTLWYSYPNNGVYVNTSTKPAWCQ